MHQWIWQAQQWPHFAWQYAQLAPLLAQVQADITTLMAKAGVHTSEQTALNTLLQNIISSSLIEGEKISAESVRSSLAKRLGLEHREPTTDRSEGLAQLMMDVIDHSQAPLTLKRLYQWHEWLFPEDAFSVQKINVGALRGSEPMQVKSGRLDRPNVHFEAPPRKGLEQQLQQFIDWFNNTSQDESINPIMRAGITHFWFITLHPFDDGNGRMARALTDLALAQGDSQSVRLFSMSLAILNDRKNYYQILETSQKADVDITAWLNCFLLTLKQTVSLASENINRTIVKARFWQQHVEDGLNQEQTKVLNRLLDGDFELGINAGQYQKVAKVSKATATRHLSNLLDKNCLEKLPGGGRSTRYVIRSE